MTISSTCGTWAVTWPYPQAHYGDYYTLGFARADQDDCAAGLPAADSSIIMYELVNDGTTWTATARYDMGLESQIDQIDVMDFGQFYAVSAFGWNGATPVITGTTRVPGATGDPYMTALPTINAPKFISGANINGQAMIGGIVSTDAEWSALGLPGVAWSAIGHFNFKPGDMHNVAGYRRMPWENNGKGIVYKIMKLGKGALVLGDGGRAYMYPVSEPTVTFGMQEFSGMGVRSGNHVAGDENIICFIDRNYDLWKVGADLQFEKLGYREYMQALVTYSPGAGDGRLLMNYVPNERRFYFSNGNESYVLTEFGLYTTDQMVTAVGSYLGNLAGFWLDGSDEEIRLTSDIIDGGVQGLKTIEGVEYGVRYEHATGTLSSAMTFRYEYGDGERTLGWVPVNPRGIAAHRVTARDFKIKLKGTTYKNASFNMDSIIGKMKYSDKRNIRGRINVS